MSPARKPGGGIDVSPALAARVWAGVGSIVLALAVGTGLWMGRGSKNPGPASATQSIAVLPLVDLSAQQDQQYFADGLTEDLLNALANNPQLRVAGRTSAFQFRNSHDDPREIGEEAERRQHPRRQRPQDRQPGPDHGAAGECHRRFQSLVRKRTTGR